jgi:beta-lactam-binding protein with PASTA domain
MKAILRLVLLSLVLVIVALISAVTAMRFAIHGREVAVPKLIGLTPIEADRAITATGLQLVIERQYYSGDIPEGKIMMQVPDAGSKVRRGWQVRVAQSLGPQRVAIPDVRGDSSRAAQMTIQRRGLDLASTASVPMTGVAPDQVVGQSPPPNASGVSAPRISLLVASPTDAAAFVMPNFVGQSLADASGALQAAGMKLGTVTVRSSTPDQNQPTSPDASPAMPQPQTTTPAPDSLILSQTPPAGQKIFAGSVVSFEVSK